MVKRTILFLVIAFGIIGFAFYEATGVKVNLSRESGKTVLEEMVDDKKNSGSFGID